MAKTSNIRVSSAAPYERDGFVVEQFDGEFWSVPGWVEDLWGGSGFFATEAEANAFLELVAA